MKKILLAVGCILALVGAVGCAVPFLPVFPFWVAAGACFAKSSDALYGKFTSTKLYKKNFESYLNGKGMTRNAKARVILSLSAVMCFGFVMIENTVGKAVMASVWMIHLIYFIFGVKTFKK